MLRILHAPKHVIPALGLTSADTLELLVGTLALLSGSPGVTDDLPHGLLP